MSAVSDISGTFAIAAFLCLVLKYLLDLAHTKIAANREILREKDVARQKLINKPEYEFYRTHAYSWDWIIVFQVHDEKAKLTRFQMDFSLKKIVNSLGKGGLETKLFYSIQRDEIYCKIRCRIERLKQEADRINYKLLLNESRLRSMCEAGRQPTWKPIKIGDPFSQCKYGPYQYIYGKYEYENSDLQPLYTLYGSQIFRGVDRIKLIRGIMEASVAKENGCGLDITKLEKEKAILAIFPLHDKRELYELQSHWMVLFQWPWNQCVDTVKNYFGEKIGLYFVWLGHYTTWLLIPSIIGFACWINVAIDDNNPNAPSIPFFATSMALWTTLYLEFWKRKEKETALQWGMYGFESEEQTRPQFIGQDSTSPINGEYELYFPYNEQIRRFSISQAVIGMMIIIVIVAVGATFYFKRIIVQEPTNSTLTIAGIELAPIIASIASAVQIQVLNAIYGGIALKMTDLENHRTSTAYEDNLIAKTFMFQFVNSYAALFYIAFVKTNIVTSEICLVSCMSELQTTLGTIFLTRLATGNLGEIGGPVFKSYTKKKKETEGAEVTRELSDCELEFFAEEYDEMLGTFGDYIEMVIQFGYTTLFVAAFPLAPAMAFINNYIELRVDAWKLCQLSRRPIPSGAEDIGTWYSILEIMSTIAVIINGALIFFTGTQTVNLQWIYRLWYFILFEHGLILFKLLLAFLVPDVPASVEIQLERQDFIVSRVIDNIADDDLDVTELEQAQTNLNIYQNDPDIVA